MADYRYFKTIFWNDPYIKDECKTVSEKELFIWLFTNGHSTQAGIYPISTKTISEETGISLGRVKEIFGKFIKDRKIKYQDKVLWVINFLKHQPNKSSKVLKRIAEDLEQLDNHPLVEEFLEKYNHLEIPYQYPIHTLSDKEKEKEKNTKGKEKESKDSKAGKPVLSKTTKDLLDKVYKQGFNIYALLGRFKKKSKVDLPEAVIEKVCNSYLKNHEKIQNDWPWFITAVEKASREYFAEQSIKENQEYKKQPVAQSIKDIMRGIK